MKILRNYIFDTALDTILSILIQLDHTETSEPNFAQLKIYQVQMFG